MRLECAKTNSIRSWPLFFGGEHGTAYVDSRECQATNRKYLFALIDILFSFFRAIELCFYPGAKSPLPFHGTTNEPSKNA